MRLRIGLFAPAVFMLLMDAAASPTVAAETVNLDSLDACSLLTAEEMSAAVGVAMDSGRHFIPRFTTSPEFKISGEVNNQCTWTQIPLPPPQQFQITLSLWIMSATYYDRQKEFARNITSVQGLGEDAYYDNSIYIPVLIVRNGALYIKVDETSFADRQTIMDAERSIAAQVLLEL
jgi:hypothetical protein